jgi:molybdopterin/thiamine biosynthesis adenylyltransferase
MPDGSQIDVPIVQENTTNDVESSNEPLLPQNSPTLLMDDSTTRFSGAEWFNEIQRKTIIIAGQGGIGSNLSFQLARMHPAGMYLYDDDTVEMVNMAGQLYARDDIGKAKVDAIADMITKYTNMQGVIALNQKFTSSDEAGDIMLCGFDNMEARRTFFNAWQQHVFSKPKEEWKNCLFLDGRLSIDMLQVFCITGDNAYAMTEYVDKYLFSDSEAEHTVCSMKQTTYLACMIGSIISNLFVNFVAGTLNPVIPYDLPFFTVYDAQNMIFKTEN